MLVRRQYLRENHSYSDLTKHVPGAMNEKSPVPKYVTTKHKTSRTETTAQKLLNRKGKKDHMYKG